MDSDWTVACGADDPEIVVPWSGKNPSLHFVDLRQSPERMHEIPEAAAYPCIAAALRRWNAPGTALFTAKCDVWSYPAKLFDAEDLPEFAFGHGSYIDIVSADPSTFRAFETCERHVQAWTQISQSIDLPACRTEWIVRHARILSTIGAVASTETSAQDGFATTLYCWGYGDSPEAAAVAWDAASRSLIEPVSAFSQS